MITHLVDAIYRQGNIKLVSMHHEQAAAFAAEAVARINGRPGVALATSGPGATNLLTGIGSCYFDSVPVVFITGQVNRDEQKGARNIRQLGFQETDIVAMAEPITKAAWRVTSPEELPTILTKAFQIALSGRPGPVLVDVPMDVQRLPCEGTQEELDTSFSSQAPLSQEIAKKLLHELYQAERPVILAGGGVRAAKSADFLRQFVERLDVPVVHSLMGVDLLPYQHPLNVGMIGSYGNRWANLSVASSDFLLVLGSRLDIRQTSSNVTAFRDGRTIYHVDCDWAEINNRVLGCHPIHADLRDFFQVMLPLIQSEASGSRDSWLKTIAELRRSWPDTAELRDIGGVNPNVFMHQLSATCQAASAYVIDVGQHQMWAAQSIEVGESQRFLTSGGMGAMGFALPSAVGAAFACPTRPVIVVAGDGSFQVNIQELQTIVRNNLPVKMVVLNNQCHGMVRQFQQSYFQERYQSTAWGYSTPDFASVARAYGIKAFTVNNPSDVEEGLSCMWQDQDTPFLLEVAISEHANAYPKTMFGKFISEMEPVFSETTPRDNVEEQI